MRRDSVGSNGSYGMGAQRPAFPRRTSSSLAVEQERIRARSGSIASINSIGNNYTRPAPGSEVIEMPSLQLPLEDFSIAPRRSRGKGKSPPMQSRGPSTSSLSSRSSADTTYSFGDHFISRGAY
jgi:hypothetical protein